MPHTTPTASASSLCTPRTLLKGATITLCVNTGIALMLWWANTLAKASFTSLYGRAA